VVKILFEIIDGFKNGFATWKLVWLRQIIVQMILSFFLFFLIVPFSFLIAIFGSNQGYEVNQNQNNSVILSLLDSILKNPGLWIAIFAMFILIVSISTILAGVTQNIAHQRLENENVILEDNFKGGIPLFIPLVILSTVTILIISIPLLIASEIFNLFDDTNAPIVFSFPIFDSSANLTLIDIVSSLGYFVIVVVLIGPYFLAITAIVKDKAGINSIAEAWRLYFQNFASVVIAMLSFFIIGFISFLILYIPINGIVIAGNETPTNLPLLFLSIFVLMILGLLFQYVVNNWMYTSLYCYYKEIKE
jgi:hypothetical protein